MTYTLIMTVGIDTGIYACDGCGALVPHDRRRTHDEFHADLLSLDGPGRP